MMTKHTYSPKASEILDVAENHMRKGGFDAVSFRDLAGAVGVKSASVHYHFPQKTDLGQAVVARYRGRVLESLGDADDVSGTTVERLERLLTIYRTALTDADSVCLCNMLGAEAQYLPEDVAAEVDMFFKSVLSWTVKALSSAESQQNAEEWASYLLSSLQGAMVLSVATNDHNHYHNTEKLIRQSVQAVFR
ncbi:MAG: TetR/AcrR family transcriptional regulator [Kordiimonas sp.]